MIQETKEKLKKAGKEKYFLNFVGLVLGFGVISISKIFGGIYSSMFILLTIGYAIYSAYYKVYLMDIIYEKKDGIVERRKYLNIVICNFISLMIFAGITIILSKFLYLNFIIPYIIGYFSSIILNIIFAPIEYTFFSGDYIFFEGVLSGLKLLNKRKKELLINNIKILGTHILNILTLKLFTIQSASFIYGINYSSIIKNENIE